MFFIYLNVQIFYELTHTVRASEELLLGKREPLNLDAAFGELMATSEDRSERDSGKSNATINDILRKINRISRFPLET
jgi:hypothetical protein